MLKQEALARIRQGVARFQSDIYPAQREMFERLRRGQEPLAMFLTCADSRVNPNLVTQTDPGEIFIERNPGNMVPPYVEFVGGVTAGVEYAMLVLKVPVIVVCGHTDCGVMKALLDPGAVHGMPGVQRWMSHGVGACERMLREFPFARKEEQLQRLTEYNVLQQIENLMTHPSVNKRLRYGELEIRGWVYDIGDGSICEADPKTGEFAPLSGKEM
ncbi:MAG TPA: carbonic anhydrase [Candidatus Eisenbacteria bacterium]|nr:carbonic anhydrase [Candidatus Eisenbacteria bacterium]